MVFLEQTSHGTYYSLTTVEATALLFVQPHVKGAIIVDHATPPHGKIGRTIPDDCERTVTVHSAANSSGYISGELGTTCML